MTRPTLHQPRVAVKCDSFLPVFSNICPILVLGLFTDAFRKWHSHMSISFFLNIVYMTRLSSSNAFQRSPTSYSYTISIRLGLSIPSPKQWILETPRKIGEGSPFNTGIQAFAWKPSQQGPNPTTGSHPVHLFISHSPSHLSSRWYPTPTRELGDTFSLSDAPSYLLVLDAVSRPNWPSSPLFQNVSPTLRSRFCYINLVHSLHPSERKLFPTRCLNTRRTFVAPSLYTAFFDPPARSWSTKRLG